MGRFLRFLVRSAVLVAALVLLIQAYDIYQVEPEGADAPTYGGAGVVLLIVFVMLRRRGGASSPRSTSVPATIMRIWQDPRPGSPGIYWTFALFDARGERIRVHLSKSQARQFLDQYTSGDVGRLTYRGETLIQWEPASVEHPVGQARGAAFISYERSWSDDAEYVAKFLESRGLKVWIDTDRLRVGGELAGAVDSGISRADFFVPLLSNSYWTSAWCLRELAAARQRGMPLRPIKVEAGRLVPPPHMRGEAAELLDSAVYVDLRGREPIAQLDEFVGSLAALH